MSRILCLFCALPLMAGCGDGGGDPGKPVYPVSGTVTMFGKPLDKASIAFAPTADGQPTAFGTTDAEGKFSLTTYEFGDGAAEGRFNVVVSKSMAAAAGGDSEDDGHSENPAVVVESHGKDDAANGQSMVPPNYSSSEDTPLSAEVKKDGENVFTFEIK